MSIGDNLKKMRKEMKMTQKELGKKVGIKQPTISAIENGVNKPEYETLVLLSEALNCSVSELIGQSSEKMVDLDMARLHSIFDQLNREGKARLMEQAEFYLSCQKYRKEEPVSQAK